MTCKLACVVTLVAAAAAVAAPSGVSAQVGVPDRDTRIAYSPQWSGERFADGRPKVPDEAPPEQYFCSCWDETGTWCWPHFRLFRRPGNPNWIPICSACDTEILPPEVGGKANTPGA